MQKICGMLRFPLHVSLRLLPFSAAAYVYNLAIQFVCPTLFTFLGLTTHSSISACCQGTLCNTWLYFNIHLFLEQCSEQTFSLVVYFCSDIYLEDISSVKVSTDDRFLHSLVVVQIWPRSDAHSLSVSTGSFISCFRLISDNLHW